MEYSHLHERTASYTIRLNLAETKAREKLGETAVAAKHTKVVRSASYAADAQEAASKQESENNAILKRRSLP